MLFGTAGVITALGLASLGSPETFALAVFGCVAVYGVQRFWRERRWRALLIRNAHRGRNLANAQWQWKRLVEAWNRECSTAVFNEKLEKLKRAREELDSWASKRQRKLRTLRREVASRSREFFLEGKRIDRANLSLRREDIAALASFGIETAADVLREYRKLMHAISSTSAHELQSWAAGHSRSFVFDKNATPDPELVAEAEARLAERRQELLTILRNGPEVLEMARMQIESGRKRLEPEMKTAWAELQAAREAASE